MPAISTEKLIVALEQSGLLEPSVVEEVRRRVAKAPGKVDPRSVTKWLVQKKYLTVEQGLEFLDGRIPAPAAPQPAPKRNPKEDLVLADDLEVIEDVEVVDDANLEVVDDDLEVVDEDLEVVDEDLEVLDESDVVESPAPKAGASRPRSKPPSKPKARPAAQPVEPDLGANVGLDDLQSLGQPGLGPLDGLAADPLAAPALGTAAAATGAAVSIPRLGKKKAAKKGNVWDSPLLLIGGGALLAMLILGGVLYWSIFRTTGDEAFKLAEDDYQSGSYTQAIHKFDKYLEQFPKHKDVSLARVHRGLAYMRQITEGTSDWTKALTASQETLEQIASENEFPQARAELAALLPKIAEGLAEQGRKNPNHTLVQKTESALALVQKYVPRSMQPTEQLQVVQRSLELTRLQLARDESLQKALTEIKAAVAGNNTAQAYEIRRALLRTYPDLEQDSTLQDAILAVSQAEKDDVVLVSEDRPGVSDEVSSPILATTTLVSRRDGNLAEGAGRTVFALADGSAYGLDAATGKVLWRRHVGYDTQFVPRAFSRAGTVEALLIDSVRKELVCLEAATGKLRWRQSLGDAVDAQPLVLRDRIAAATSDGRLVLVDLATGNSSGHVKFPHSLSVAPATDPRQRRLYQIAEHSNLYVLSAENPRCEEVIYVGHASGSVRVPPFCVSRYVMVAENNGASDSTLRVYLANEEGLSLKLVQSISLEGHVHVPMQLSGSKTLVLCTDRGAFHAFDIGGTEKKEPLTRVAGRPGTDSESTLRFFLVRGPELWLADKQFTKHDIQAAQGRVAIRWTENDGDVFLQPLEEVGDALIHVRRKRGLPGVAVAAAKKNDGKIIWETHLAAPLAGNPLANSEGNAIAAMNLVGSAFHVPVKDSSAILESKPGDPRAIQPVGKGAGSVVLPDGGQLWLLGEGSARLWHCKPGAKSAISEQTLPFPAATSPVVLKDLVLVPTLAGQIIEVGSGQAGIEPFQPKLEAGMTVAWQRPAVTANGELLVPDGALKLYRLAVEDKPRPHLAAKATAELDTPIATPVTVVEQSAFAADAKGYLTAFKLPDLSHAEQWKLGAPVAQGPAAVGDVVLVSTSDNRLFCFDGQPTQRWETELPYGPLAGEPLLLGEKIVLASVRGVVWTINPADGLEQKKVELGQPLASAPVALGDRLIVAGADGVLHAIATP